MEAVLGLLCIVVPVVIAFCAGYMIGKKGRPRLSIKFDNDGGDLPCRKG